MIRGIVGGKPLGHPLTLFSFAIRSQHDYDIITQKFAAVHDRFGFLSKLSPSRNFRTQQITCAQVNESVLIDQIL